MQPSYAPPQPAYAPPQPAYAPPQPAYPPPQPAYAPQQPAYTPQQPAYAPQQPAYARQQPAYTPQPRQPTAYPAQSNPADSDGLFTDKVKSGFPDIGSLKGFGNIDNFGSLSLGKGRASRSDPFTTNLFDSPSAAQSLVGNSRKGEAKAPSSPTQSYGGTNQYGSQAPTQAASYPGSGQSGGAGADDSSPYKASPYSPDPYSRQQGGRQAAPQPSQQYNAQSPAQGAYQGGAPGSYPSTGSNPATRGSSPFFGNNLLGAQDGNLLNPVSSLYPPGLDFKQPAKSGNRLTNPYSSGGQSPPSPFGNSVGFQRPASATAQSGYQAGEEVPRGTAYNDVESGKSNKVYNNQNAYGANGGNSNSGQGGYDRSGDYANQKDTKNAYSDGGSGSSANAYQNQDAQTNSYHNNAANKQNLGYDQNNQYNKAKPPAVDGVVTYEAPPESNSKANLPPINALPSTGKQNVAPPTGSEYAPKKVAPLPQKLPENVFIFPSLNKRRPGQTNIFGKPTNGGDRFSPFGNLGGLL